MFVQQIVSKPLKAIFMKTKSEKVNTLLGKVVGYAKDNQNKPIYEVTKEIKVKLINWDSLIEKMKKSDKDLQKMDFEVRNLKGIIFVGKDKTPVLIDNECCGIETETKNISLKGKFHTVRFVDSVSFYVKLKGAIAIFPKFAITLDYSDVEKCMTGEEQELWEFMGDRYEYNPRIQNNLIEIVRLYKGIEKM